MALPNQPTGEETLALKGSNDTRSKDDLLPGAMASLALWGFAISAPGRYITTLVLLASQPAECLLHSADEKNQSFCGIEQTPAP